MIIVILHETIPSFEATLENLFNNFQGLRPIIAIPIICFIPVFVMIFFMPFFLYGYGKVHVLLFTDKDEKRARPTKADLEEKEFEKKVFQTMDELDNFAFQLQQYLLELQGLPKQIIEVDNHKTFKALNMRLNMMKDYIDTIALEDTKETKKVMIEEDVKTKIKEVEMQKKTAVDLVKQNIKKLQNEKKEFEKDPDEIVEEEEQSEELEAEVEIREPTPEVKVAESEEVEANITPVESLEEEKDEELQDPSEIIDEDLNETEEK